MHIGIVCEFFPHIIEDGNAEGLTGGAETSSYYLSKYLSQNNRVTILAARALTYPDVVKYKNITVVRVGKPHWYTQLGQLKNRYFLIRDTSKILSQLGDLDIVECYTWFSYAVTLPKKIPSVIAYHDIWLGKWIPFFGLPAGMIFEVAERWIQRRKWDAFITRTNYMKQQIIKCGIKADKIYVVPDGVELDAIPVSNEKFNSPTICFLGRLVQYKRAQDVIVATKILKRHFPKIQCKIIGDGPMRNWLENLVRELNLQPNVEFLGKLVTHQEVFEIVQKSHVFCLPSVTEGFGIAILEAMACGVPYVCSSIPTLVEVTKNGKGGLLFTSCDVEDLALKIESLLREQKMYQNKVEEGKEFVQQYQWKNIAKHMENVYSEIIEKKK